MNAENEKHAFENSKDILAFISGFFCDLIQSNQIKTEQLIDLSEYLYKERQSFSDTLARERAVEFHFNQLYGDLISSGNSQITQQEIEGKKNHIRELYDVEKAFDDIGDFMRNDLRKAAKK